MKAELSPGTQIGFYRIEGQLGEGGMGVVYRAVDNRFNRSVAIKFLPDHVLDSAARQRFQREAQVTSSLNHPHILTIYDIGEFEDRQYLVAEFVDGGTLNEWERSAKHTWRQVVVLLTGVADGLAVAHEAGILHRDIKPANILVAKNNYAKLADFGLAKLTEAAHVDATRTLAQGVTARGVIVGTVAYMSPEQASGRALDARSDIFSFGVVLYEMLAGRPPFIGATTLELLNTVIDGSPEPLSKNLPDALRNIVEKALEKDPDDRYQSMREMVVDLRRLARAESRSTEEPVLPARWRRSPVSIAGAVLLAIVAGAAGWLAHRSPDVFDNPLANARFTRLTDFPGSEMEAAISRDGKFVAFLSDREGSFDAWISRLGSGQFVNLTQGKAGEVRAPYRSIGFTANGSDVWLAGGNPGSRIRLVPLMGGESHNFLAENSSNLAWSPDGTRLVYHTRDPGDPMFIADRTGLNARQIFISEPGIHNHYPVWSPDGRWIYFVRGRPDISEMDIWRIPSGGGNPERMTEHNNDVAYPTPLDARTVLYVSREEDGSGPWLWELDPQHKRTRRSSFGLEKYTSLAASADGRRLVATVANPSATLWTVPILDHEVTESEAKPLAIPTLRALSPRYRGSSLFYLSSTGGHDGLWRYQNGHALEILRGADGPLFASPDVSPDGGHVAVVLRRQGRLRLYSASSDGAELQLLTDAIDVRGAVSWSPDGKWIVAGGDDGNGPGLFKVPIRGGAPVRLVSGIARDPVWSPNGTLIVYSGLNVATTARLLAVNADGTRVQLPPIEVRREGERARFTPDGNALIYMQGLLPAQDFWLLDLTTRKTRRLTRLNNSAAMRTFDVTPDGSQIVFDRLRDNSDIVLIELPNKGS